MSSWFEAIKEARLISFELPTQIYIRGYDLAIPDVRKWTGSESVPLWECCLVHVASREAVCFWGIFLRGHAEAGSMTERALHRIEEYLRAEEKEGNDRTMSLDAMAQDPIEAPSDFISVEEKRREREKYDRMLQGRMEIFYDRR